MLIREYPYRRPDSFRSVRDLGLVRVGCPRKCGEPEGRSSAWLLPSRPAALDAWTWTACRSWAE
jgi:hypothetical protein